MLNTPSLLIGHSVSLFTVTLLLCLVWMLRFPFRGTGWWTCSYLCASMGIIILSFRAFLPFSLAVVSGNLISLFTFCLIWNGLRLFLGKKGLQFINWVQVGVAFAIEGYCLFWFVAVEKNINVRFVLFSLFASGLLLLIVRDIWSHRQKYRAIRLLIFLCLSYTCAVLTRMVVLVGSSYPKPWDSLCNHIFIFINDITFISTAFCLLMMISERLLQVVTKQYQELDENMKFRKQMESLLYHDLKSPMLPIVYLPDILLKNEQLSDAGKNKLCQIREAAQRIMGLLNEALVAHKFESRKQAESNAVDILELLRTVNTDLHALQSEKNLHVILQAASELASPQTAVIQGDESLLYRMFANLLKNAIQASPANNAISVRLDRDRNRLRIAIQNNGEVPKNLQSKFFDKYARDDRSEGLGLGTYSAKLAVEAHGGDIALNSSLPGMTEVDVWLPFEQTGENAPDSLLA